MEAKNMAVYAVKWKADLCPGLEEWKIKLDEYTVMAKLTTYLRNRSIMQFEDRQNVYYMYEETNLERETV